MCRARRQSQWSMGPSGQVPWQCHHPPLHNEEKSSRHAHEDPEQRTGLTSQLASATLEVCAPTHHCLCLPPLRSGCHLSTDLTGSRPGGLEGGSHSTSGKGRSTCSCREGRPAPGSHGLAASPSCSLPLPQAPGCSASAQGTTRVPDGPSDWGQTGVCLCCDRRTPETLYTGQGSVSSCQRFCSAAEAGMAGSAPTPTPPPVLLDVTDTLCRLPGDSLLNAPQ